jgi:hypothetical protein
VFRKVRHEEQRRMHKGLRQRCEAIDGGYRAIALLSQSLNWNGRSPASYTVVIWSPNYLSRERRRALRAVTDRTVAHSSDSND